MDYVDYGCWGIHMDPENLERELAREVTEAEPTHLEHEDIHCACDAIDNDRRKKGKRQRRQAVACSKATNCICYKNGSGCTETCTCASCANPLKILPSFFGKDGVRAGLCFRQWLDVFVQEGTPLDLSCPTIQEHLRSQLFGVKEGNLSATPTPDVFIHEYDEELAKLGKDEIGGRTSPGD